jgi:hypothetical protein
MPDLPELEEALRNHYADQADDPAAEQRIRDQIAAHTPPATKSARSRRRVLVVAGIAAAVVTAVGITIGIAITHHTAGAPVAHSSPTARQSYAAIAPQHAGAAAADRPGKLLGCGPTSTTATDTFALADDGPGTAPKASSPSAAALEFTEHGGKSGYGTPATRWTATAVDPHDVFLQAGNTWLHVTQLHAGWIVDGGGHCT